MQRRALVYEKKGAPGGLEKTFFFWLAVAVAIHVAIFLGLVALKSFDRVQKFKPRVVSVSLLSLPGSGGSSEKVKKNGPVGGKPAPEKVAAKPISEPVPKQEPTVAKKVPVQPAKKTAAVPAKKEDALASALDRLKKGVEQKKSLSGADNLNMALSRLKAGSATSASGSGTKGSGSGTGGSADRYKAEVAGIIQKNWEFSGSLLRNTSGMEVFVQIRVQANGTIAQIVFDHGSPSEYLNNSVKKALEKSSPLPPFPPEYGSPQEWIRFVFTPDGIE